MKKTMMIVAAMLFAVASVQAVSLKWNGNIATASLKGLTSGALLTTGPTSQTASMIAYFVLATDLSTVQASRMSEVDFIALNKTKATALGLTATSTAAAGRVGTSTTILGSTSGVEYFARVYATFGTKDYYMDLKNGNTAYWKTSVSGADSVQENFAWANATYGGATGENGEFNKWVAVPEPTSLALLAIGAAAIGLRRKFRK